MVGSKTKGWSSVTSPVATHGRLLAAFPGEEGGATLLLLVPHHLKQSLRILLGHPHRLLLLGLTL